MTNESSNVRTELSSLGEFGLIDRIKEHTELVNPSSILGIGDDAAVIEKNETHYTLLSKDLLLEGTHFDLMYTPLKHLGYKAVAVNVSDIAAMNGIPKQILVGIGVSNRFSLEAIEELYLGIRTACKAYNVDLIGGDTTSSRLGLHISVTVIGEVEKDKISYRSGAKKGDILCVSGDLGGAYLGLQLLEREKQVFLSTGTQAELDDYPYQLEKILKPEARMDVIHEFRDLGIVPTSMIDISDGLASEILHICTKSNIGAVIFEENLPMEAQTHDLCVTELDMSPLTCLLNGGEDYELLFTIRASDYEKIKNHPDVHFIGYMTDQWAGGKLQLKSSQLVDLRAQGWDSFAENE